MMVLYAKKCETVLLVAPLFFLFTYLFCDLISLPAMFSQRYYDIANTPQVRVLNSTMGSCFVMFKHINRLNVPTSQS